MATPIICPSGYSICIGILTVSAGTRVRDVEVIESFVDDVEPARRANAEGRGRQSHPSLVKRQSAGAPLAVHLELEVRRLRLGASVEVHGNDLALELGRQHRREAALHRRRLARREDAHLGSNVKRVHEVVGLSAVVDHALLVRVQRDGLARAQCRLSGPADRCS